jgi:hypothetical protein
LNRKTQKLYMLGVCIVIILIHATPSSAQGSDSDLLQSKLSEIIILREKIAEKKRQAVDIFDQLKYQEDMLSKEIMEEQKKSGVMSYQVVNQYPRIYYDIKLIQQIKAYMKRIEEKIIFFQLSDEKLKFLYHQADDDLKIIQALNSVEINDLIEKINILKMYVNTENDQKFIDINALTFEKQETIWDEIQLQASG